MKGGSIIDKRGSTIEVGNGKSQGDRCRPVTEAMETDEADLYRRSEGFGAVPGWRKTQHVTI
jgi:hypothetical protein